MIDLLIVLGFIAYALANGIRSRRVASRGLNEYFPAGHSLRGWQAGTSMAATQFAADTPLLVTGLIATAGIFAVWRLWIYGLAFLLLAFVFAGHWRRAGVLTDAELTELRYSGPGALALRVLKAIYYGTVINCVVLAMVLVAAIRIAEVFLPWNAWLPTGLFEAIRGGIEWTGVVMTSGATGLDPVTATTNNAISILAIVAFTAGYSMTGGLRSVVATDLVQFTLAMGGTALYAWAVLRGTGGLDGLASGVLQLYGGAGDRMLSWVPPPGEALAPFLVILSLQWLFQMNSDGTGYLAQRSMACRTTDDARVAGVVFAWLQIVLRSLLWLIIAVGLLVLYPFAAGEVGEAGFAAQRELMFVQGIDDLLPPGARGLMLVGLLAALASTVDTHLNWGASYWANDLYDRWISRRLLGREPGGRELVVAARLSNVVVLTIALFVTAHVGSIQNAWFISLLFGAGMGGVLVLRWLWERITLWSELGAMAVSIVVAPLLLAYTDDEWLRLAIMAVLSTGAAVALALLGPRTDGETLERFYRRVRPVGWWRRTADAAGESPSAAPAALKRALVSTGLTSASLFLVLAGAGRLIAAPADARTGVSLILLAAGALLVPIWLPRVRRGHDHEVDAGHKEKGTPP